MTHIFRTAMMLAVASLMLASHAFAQDSNYRIQPGDILDVTVLEDAALNRQVLVGPDGRISLPLAGTVRAGGQTIEAVEANIAKRLASNFAVAPNVFVALTALAPDRAATVDELDLIAIYVMGQVGSPGRLQLERGTSLLQAVALAGGLGRFAATKRIQLRRVDPNTGRERLFLFNFKAVEQGGSIRSTMAMRDGDVIIVPERRLFE